MERTEDTLDEQGIRDLLSYEFGDPTSDTIDTHDGQWQREDGGLWRFWLNEDRGPSV